MTESPNNQPIYEILAAAFEAEGTEVMFALQGDGNMHWSAALTELGVKGIYVRHEHAACAAASTYANVTGKVGVASVTCGPGLSQLSTALATAAHARIPLVVFAGESPRDQAFYNQYINQEPMVEATGAKYISAKSLPRMTDYVRDAFFIARTERIPVVLGVPLDVQKQPFGRVFDYKPSAYFIPQLAPMAPNPQEIETAVKLIGNAAQVVVIAGKGALHGQAQKECETLADLCGGLLATTLPARGMFDHHPFSIGIAGGYSRDIARKVFAQADLVIAVGAALNPFTRDAGKLFDHAKIIQIDNEPVGLKHGRKVADYYVRADAKLALKAILEQFPKAKTAGTWRTDDLAHEIAQETVDATEFPPQEGLIDPRAAVAAIDAIVPKDWEVVNSSGHCAFFSAHLRGRKPENFSVIREFGAIGNGLSYAIGMAVARPERPVLLIDGDGSLLMHSQELDTVRRHGLNILLCILNDGAYGSEIHKMRADGISDAGAVFGRGDLAAISRGYGLRGATITHLDQFKSAFEAFSKAGGGAELWDIHIADNVTSPVMRHHMK